MQGKRIRSRSFFTCPAEELAVKLLGKVICRRNPNGFVLRCRINVTEAYCEDDPVNDAVRAAKSGKTTAQTKEGGHLYVKPFLGRFRFDIVAGEAGVGESVLIRGVDPYQEGPIIAASALNINKELDGMDLLDQDSDIWLEEDNAKIIPARPSKRKLGKMAPQEARDRLRRFEIREITVYGGQRECF